MKEKGFTLIELIAVIIILAVVALIATPTVWKYVKNSKQRAYDHQLLEIYDATENYFTDNLIMIDNGEVMYVSVGELVESNYLDNIPNDQVNGGKMNGVIEVTGTVTNNNYKYLSTEELSEKDSITLVDNSKMINQIIVSGKSINKERSLLEILADKVVNVADNSETMKVENYESFVTDSNDIQSVQTEWFKGIFETNTVYTFTIDSRAISPTSANTSYYPKMRFVYTDGTKSQEYIIGKHSDETFTTYTYSSDSGKSVRSIEFTTTSESPYRFAYNLETFSITPTTVSAPYYESTIKSLGDTGMVTLKIVSKTGSVTSKKVSLLDPLRSVSNISDKITVLSSGSVEVTRNIGKVTLDGYGIKTSDVSIYSGSLSSTGYQTFVISNVFKDKKSSSTVLMSNAFPYLANCWSNSTSQIGICANSSNSDKVYIRVPQSDFPDVNSLINYLKNESIDIYYELATSEVETLSSISIDSNDVSYIYVDSNLSPKITVSYK